MLCRLKSALACAPRGKYPRSLIILGGILASFCLSCCTSAPADESDKVRMLKIERVIDHLGH